MDMITIAASPPVLDIEPAALALVQGALDLYRAARVAVLAVATMSPLPFLALAGRAAVTQLPGIEPGSAAVVWSMMVEREEPVGQVYARWLAGPDAALPPDPGRIAA